MRHVHALLAVALASLACGGLGSPEEPVGPPPASPSGEEATCEEPDCARVGRDLLVRSVDHQLVVLQRGEPTGQRLEDGLVQAVQLDGDSRKEILVARDCGGNGCLPDWTVLDCGDGGRCLEAPLVQQVPEVRVADASDGRHEAWALGDGTIRCFRLERGRAQPCDGWREEVGPPRTRLAPVRPPTIDDDGQVVAHADLDLDGDGTAEYVACTWWEQGHALQCHVPLHGVDVAIAAAPEIAFLGTTTNGVLDVAANGRTGRWDGAAWVFAW